MYIACSILIRSPSSSTFFDLNFFLHVWWHKKNKISAYHVFRKYHVKTIYSGSNFSNFRDFRLILSQLSQFLRQNQFFGLVEKQEKQQQKRCFFLLGGHWKWNYPKRVFLIFLKLSTLIENYHLLLPSKSLEGDFCCLENIDFWMWSPLVF
jgi:hypothetical protein